MGHKGETVGVGCKVLPICDVGTMLGPSNMNAGDDSTGSSSSDIGVDKRRKAVSRMKELIRWAAASSKAGKGGIKGWKVKVLYFRNKMGVKDPQQGEGGGDDASSNSSKISFRCDVGSCSTSSVISPLSVASTSRVHDQKWAHKKNVSNNSALVTLWSSTSDATTLDRLITTQQGCSTSNRAGQWITSDSDFVVLEL